MRALATGLIRTDPPNGPLRPGRCRRSHADRRCVEACVAYCDLVAHLLDDVIDHSDPSASTSAKPTSPTPPRPTSRPTPKLDPTLRLRPCHPPHRHPLPFRRRTAPGPTGAGPARSRTPSSRSSLDLGGDADTTGAVAGGLTCGAGLATAVTRPPPSAPLPPGHPRPCRPRSATEAFRHHLGDAEAGLMATDTWVVDRIRYYAAIAGIAPVEVFHRPSQLRGPHRPAHLPTAGAKQTGPPGGASSMSARADAAPGPRPSSSPPRDRPPPLARSPPQQQVLPPRPGPS